MDAAPTDHPDRQPDNPQATPTTAAIIVTYNPEGKAVDLIRSCLAQGCHVIVIDNNSTPGKTLGEISSTPGIHFEKMSENLGLARAQNAGVMISKASGCQRTIFFDQDTSVPDGFIADMNRAFDELRKTEPSLALLGPNYFDRNTGDDAHYAKLTPRGYKTVSLADRAEEVSFIISSGSIVETSLFDKTGPFMDKFFIDQIDTEFCLRLAKNRLKIYATPAAKIIHTIGDRQKHKIMFLTIKPNHHSAQIKLTSCGPF